MSNPEQGDPAQQATFENVVHFDSAEPSLKRIENPQQERLSQLSAQVEALKADPEYRGSGNFLDISGNLLSEANNCLRGLATPERAGQEQQDAAQLDNAMKLLASYMDSLGSDDSLRKAELSSPEGAAPWIRHQADESQKTGEGRSIELYVQGLAEAAGRLRELHQLEARARHIEAQAFHQGEPESSVHQSNKPPAHGANNFVDETGNALAQGYSAVRGMMLGPDEQADEYVGTDAKVHVGASADQQHYGTDMRSEADEMITSLGHYLQAMESNPAKLQTELRTWVAGRKPQKAAGPEERQAA